MGGRCNVDKESEEKRGRREGGKGRGKGGKGRGNERVPNPSPPLSSSL